MSLLALASAGVLSGCSSEPGSTTASTMSGTTTSTAPALQAPASASPSSAADSGEKDEPEEDGVDCDDTRLIIIDRLGNGHLVVSMNAARVDGTKGCALVDLGVVDTYASSLAETTNPSGTATPLPGEIGETYPYPGQHSRLEDSAKKHREEHPENEDETPVGAQDE